MSARDRNQAEFPLVPLPIVNPAASTHLRGRVGDHGSFLESLKRRLSSRDYPQLGRLGVRQTSDFSIALLDAWATAADVVTFYNERILNEGYLRTASEKRSLAELATLVGYQPGPGVSASVMLAFTVEKDPRQIATETIVPLGTAVKSVPGDGEMPQTFETSEALAARVEWNAIRARKSIPQLITPANTNSVERLFVEGTDHQIKPNDRILIFAVAGAKPTTRTVTEVYIDNTTGRTELVLGETPFSIKRMYREVCRQVDEFLAVAGTLTNFSWLKDNLATPLTKFTDGDAATSLPPMVAWSKLSDFDQRFSALFTSIKETEATATAADTELSKPASPFAGISQRLNDAIDAQAPVAFSAASPVCDELAKLEGHAADFVDIVNNADPTSGADMAAAKTAITAKGAATAAILTEHRDKLNRVHAATIDLADHMGDASKEAEFNNARTDLRKWWGFTNSGNLNVGGNKLKTAYDTLKPVLDGAEARPFTGKVTALATARDSVRTVTPNASGSPAQERIDRLRSLLEAPLDAYAAALKAAAGPPALLGSEILARLDERFLEPVHQDSEPLERHQAAATIGGQGAAVANAVRAAQIAARLVMGVSQALEARRAAFAEQANKLLISFTALANPAFPTIAAIWGDLEKVLNDAAKTAGDPVRHPVGLDATIAAIGDENSAGLLRRFATLPPVGDAPTERLVAMLLEELRALSALNGGTAISSEPPVQTPGGGIGQVAQSDLPPQPSDMAIVRSAEEVLQVPKNTAADVVAQLAASFGLVSLEELRAKWKALRNGTQGATAALLSTPLQLFGYNAPRPIFTTTPTIIAAPAAGTQEWTASDTKFEYTDHLHLNAELTSLVTPTYILLQVRGVEEARRISDARVIPRSDYGLNQKVTQCDLADPIDWRAPGTTGDNTISHLRTAVASVPARNLSLALAPLNATIGKNASAAGLSPEHEFEAETDQIELDGIYLGVRPAHRVIVEGERMDLPGVISREFRRVKYVRHTLRAIAGDSVHTRIYLDSPLEHTYKRESVMIYANVVRATHGETVNQVLGSGDASQAFQSFALAKGPLTYLPAPTPAGVESTLAARVNNLLWHEQATLLSSSPFDRVYAVQRDDNGRSRLQFGDGKTGARLPTGRENVRARYRVGLGNAGNVQAESITNLAHRPLGIKAATNPLPATGGADAETIDQIRANAPLAVMALDRLVSVRDYADFARNYAGIDKAKARRVFIGGQATVHVTIAGTGDIPIAPGSDLYENLLQSLQSYGDPTLAISLGVRELLIMFISAAVRIEPEFEWTLVDRAIRDALYRAFRFESRELGQDAYLSDVERVIQNVDGVQYVDVDLFDVIEEREYREALSAGTRGAQSSFSASPPRRSLQEIFDAIRKPAGVPAAAISVSDIRLGEDINGIPAVLPAQIAYLSSAVADSLFLREIRS